MVEPCAVFRGKTATSSKKAGKGGTDQRNENRLSSVVVIQLIRLYEIHISSANHRPNWGVTRNRSVAILARAIHTVRNGRDAGLEGEAIRDRNQRKRATSTKEIDTGVSFAELSADAEWSLHRSA